MREILFRAKIMSWGKDNNKWIYGIPLYTVRDDCWEMIDFLTKKRSQ